MARTLDVRGLRCPIPLISARAALAAVAPGEALVVLATDPEAPIDIAALAADAGWAFAAAEAAGVWRMELRRPAEDPSVTGDAAGSPAG
jgi:tRNA 2-thiouridine synthesizing protein A